MGLKNVLKNFSLENNEARKSFVKTEALTALQEPPAEFQNIAKHILSGYFLVRSVDKCVYVYPTCVEIYYHEEQENGVKDPIVYHRNRKNKSGGQDIPAIFDIGVLHNHVSGIDITFEKSASSNNETITGVVRASALIREFMVKDNDGHTVHEKRSTYLYQALFGQFSIFDGGFTVTWVDGSDAIIENAKLKCDKRKNVAEYQSNNYDYEKNQNKMQDARKWQFRIDND